MVLSACIPNPHRSDSQALPREMSHVTALYSYLLRWGLGEWGAELQGWHTILSPLWVHAGWKTM